jgi:hypothetical protein
LTGGDPLNFQVGDRPVWNEGIIQLNKDAKAIQTCPSYSDLVCAPPNNIPNSTLIFDIDIINFQAAEESVQLRTTHILFKHTGSRNATDSYRNNLDKHFMTELMQ